MVKTRRLQQHYHCVRSLPPWWKWEKWVISRGVCISPLFPLPPKKPVRPAAHVPQELVASGAPGTAVRPGMGVVILSLRSAQKQPVWRRHLMHAPQRIRERNFRTYRTGRKKMAGICEQTRLIPQTPYVIGTESRSYLCLCLASAEPQVFFRT